jgi:hypothetical protein
MEGYWSLGLKSLLAHSRFRSTIGPWVHSTSRVSVVTYVLVIVLLIDTCLIKIYNFASALSIRDVLTDIFVLIACTFLTSQYIILVFSIKKVKETKTELRTSKMIHKIIRICQFCISALLIGMIIEVLFISHYDTLLLETVLTVSYGSSIIILGLLAQRFLSWFRSRKSYIVLLYAFSSISFIVSNFFSILFVSNIMLRISNVIEPHGHNLLYFNNPGSFAFYLYNSYVISSILSFILTWIATAIIMHYYPKRIKGIKYWLLVSLPLIYFLSQFVSLSLNLFASVLEQSPVFYGVLLSVIFPVSKAAGGMLFGVAFWVMARTIKTPNIVRDYLVITAIGFILLFVSDQAISLIVAPYPPFGLTSVGTMGLASYLILIGLYYCAISVSNDIDLQKAISYSAIKEFNLLSSIGSAQMEEQVQQIVTRIVKEQAENIETLPAISTEDDIKDYTSLVLDEIKKQKEKT